MAGRSWHTIWSGQWEAPAATRIRYGPELAFDRAVLEIGRLTLLPVLPSDSHSPPPVQSESLQRRVGIQLEGQSINTNRRRDPRPHGTTPERLCCD